LFDDHSRNRAFEASHEHEIGRQAPHPVPVSGPFSDLLLKALV
jgi:hypothetical protein